MTSFLTALNGFYTNVGGTNETVEDCVSKIPVSSFHFYLLIPSALATLLLSFTLQRKNLRLSCCSGRPGSVFPMDILGKSHRFSYAAAWGSIAFLATDLVFGSTQIVKLEGPSYVTVFNTILSMGIIGIDYFPLFAALALESVTGYIIGTVYAWMILAVQIFREAECDLVVQTRIILVLRDLPNLLCLSYLSISIPVRTVQELRKKSIRIFSSSEIVTVLNLSKDINTTPEAVHVKELLKPPKPPSPPADTRLDKILSVVKTFVGKWIYKRKKSKYLRKKLPNHFRYSARILSVMLIGLFVIYKVTLETTVLVESFFKLTEQGFRAALDEIGWEPVTGEDESTASVRDITYLLYGLLINARICFIVSVSFACLGSVLTIMHMLSSYRSNLFDLYKGDVTHIPHRSSRSNASLLIGSMRYAGYQVAYIAWGFVLHFTILLIVSLAICVVITLIQEGFYDWILTILQGAWPALMMTIIVMLTQTLLSKFAFLQDRGEALALNNRRVLFSFTFFMFFYNIFVGFLSCLLRIIKSIGIGAVMLPRLDNSALPRRFQMFDPGFANYCGFMHVECSHTHPVMLIFLRILLMGNHEKMYCTSTEESNLQVVGDGNGTHLKSHETDTKSRTRIRWFLFYTLNNNPSLRVHRKFYLRLMKQLQDRLAKQAERKINSGEYNEKSSHDGREKQNIGDLMLEVVQNDSDINGQLETNLLRKNYRKMAHETDSKEGNTADNKFIRDSTFCDSEMKHSNSKTKGSFKLPGFKWKSVTVKPTDTE